MARQFFSTHSDSYDFLVVFPAFQTGLVDEAGLHTSVRSSIDGLGAGRPLHDLGLSFGSAQRLKGYLDVRALDPAQPQLSVDGAISVAAHEIHHQFAAFLSLQAPGLPPDALTGRDGAHWSFFFDSDASLLYGSDWVEGPPGAWTAQSSQRRYSWLDLYLMGLATPAEVTPMTVLEPAPGTPFTPTDLPPPIGTKITATAKTFGIGAVIAANGARVPDAAHAQKAFRAAFVLLLPPGQSIPTPAQVDYVDAVRRRLANEFFFLTRGRAVMETELLEVPAAPFSSCPDVSRGVDYLLSRQAPTGLWQDTALTATRDSQLALEALTLFGGDARVPISLQRGGAGLSQSAAEDVDSTARRALGLLAAHQPTSSVEAVLAGHIDRAGLNQDDGYGLARGYSSTVLDSTLALEALIAAGTAPAVIAPLIEYLVARQNSDGGWPAGAGGSSRVAMTAQVLVALRHGPQTAGTAAASASGSVFLRAHRQSDGSFGENSLSTSSTALALIALDGWQQLTLVEATSGASFLLGRQWTDGSFGGSISDTALALKALRLLRTPNLSLAVADVVVTRAEVLDGAQVGVTLTVRNTSYAASSPTQVQAYASDGSAVSTGVALGAIAAGSSTTIQLVLDTTGHAGSTQVFIAVDPGGTLDETRKDDNRAALPLLVQPAPTVPEFAVHTVVVGAPGLVSLPGIVTVTGGVDNLGQTEARDVVVELRVGGASTRTLVTIGPRSSAFVSSNVVVTHLSNPLTATLIVDPDDAFAEPYEDNNQASALVPIVPTVDVGVTALTASLSTARQGQSVTVSFVLTNGGTADASNATARVRLRDGSGALLETLTIVAAPVVAGGTQPATLVVRPTRTGALLLEVMASTSGDGNAANDSQTIPLTVTPSTLANLVVLPGQLSLVPMPPLLGQASTISAIISNTGATDAANIAVELWAGQPPSGTLLSRQTVPVVAAHGSVTVTAPFTPASSGPIDVIAKLDGDETVEEFDEADNLTVLRVTARSRADLALTSADVRLDTAFPVQGATVSVTVFVRNLGQQAASAPVLTLFLGSASTGQVLGTRTLADLVGGQETSAAFSVPTTGLTGTQILTVTASTAATEARHDNNEATTQFQVQSGPVAVSNLYFSPNGDGVKDDTSVSITQPLAAPIQVLVLDSDGATLRTLSASAATTARLVWDGRTEDGQLALDGTYQVKAFSGAGAQASLLGSIAVTLDTNRSSILAAVGTPLIRTRTWLRQYEMMMPAYATSDDSALLYGGWNQADFNATGAECGIYQQGLSGEPLQRLTPLSFDCEFIDRFPSSEWARSPDGLKFAGITRVYSGNRNVGKLWLFDLSTGVVRVVATGVVNVVELAVNTFPPIFHPNGEEIFFGSLIPASNTLQVEAMRLDGSMRRVVSVMPRNFLSASLSPKADYFAWVMEDRSLMTNPLGGPLTVQFPAPFSPVSVIKPQAPLVTWLSDTEVLVAVGNSSNVRALDVRTGVSRTVLTAPKVGAGLSPDRKALATLREKTNTNDGTSFSSDAVLVSNPVGSPATLLGMVSSEAGNAITFSPLGSFLYDPRQGGGFVSLGNLTNSFTARRSTNSVAFTFRGTVTDLNFDSFEVAVRPYRSTVPLVVVARGTTSVIDGDFAQWVPSASGLYEVQVTATDLAGNTRRSTTQLVSPDTSVVVSNIQRTPEVISPNGDGTHDEAILSYTASGPTTFDVSVTAADGGATIRRMSRTALASGPGTAQWDGRDDVGASVPEGDYAIELEGARVGVAVDVTPPAVTLEWNHPLGTGSVATFARGVVPAFTCRQRELGLRFVPAILALYRHAATDPHLKSWAIESSAPYSQSGFGPSKTGADPLPHQEAISLSDLAGRSFRIRSEDHGGNLVVSPASRPAERLFVLGLYAPTAPTFDVGCVEIPGGRQLPGLDAFVEPTNTDASAPEFDLSALELPPAGTAASPRRLAIALASSISEPLAEVTATVTSPLGLNVPVLPTTRSDLVMLDTSFLNAGTPPSEVQVVATTITGRTFSTTLRLKTGTVVAAGGSVCSSGVGGLRIEIPGAAPTGTVSYFSRSTGALEASQPFVGTGVYDTSTLSQCRYSVVVATTIAGQPTTLFQDTDVCGLILQGVSFAQGSLVASVREDMHGQVITSLDLMTSRDGNTSWSIRGTFPGFAGDTTLSVPLLTGDTCRPIFVRLTARLADGSMWDSIVSSSGCSSPPPLEVPCLTLSASAARANTAPWCSANSAVWAASVNASAPLAAASANFFPLVGQPRMALPLLFTPGDRSAVANIDTLPLVEGRYLVSFDVTDSVGLSRSALLPETQSIVVDKTPALATLSLPNSGTVCPLPERRLDGTIQHVFQVSGTVSDANPEQWAVLLRAPGQPTPVVAFEAPLSSAGNVSTRIVADGIPGGEYELFLGARDVSGGSTCTQSAVIRLGEPVRVVQSAAVNPALISPDGDGLLEATTFALSLNVQAQVALEVSRQGVLLGRAFDLTLPAGVHSLPWDGTIAGALVADGEYRLEAVARDACGKTSRVGLDQLVTVDVTRPVARIDLPTLGALVQATVSAVGTASDLHFSGYELAVGSGATPSVWVPITSGQAPVSARALGTIEVSAFTPGLYTLRLRVSDLAGHVETVLTPITVQPTAALVSFDVQPKLVSPDGDGILDVAEATVQLRAQGQVTIEVLSQGSVVYSLMAAANQPAGTVSYPFPQGALAALGDGMFEVRVTVGTDVATSVLELDTAPPQVAILSPTAPVPGRTPLQLAVNDTHLTAWELRHTQPNGTVTVLAAGVPPPSGLADLTGLSNGTHRLELQADDAAGHRSITSVSFLSDSILPLVAFRSPLQGALLSGGRGLINVEAAITEAHVASIVVDWAPTVGARHRIASLSSAPASGLLTAWDAAAETDGPGQLIVLVTDTSGNTADAVVEVVLDSTPPLVTVSSPSPGLVRTLSTVIGTITDARLTRWDVSVGEGEPGATQPVVIGSGTLAVSAGALAVLSGTLASGVHTLRVHAVDAAANERTVEVRVVVDSTPPAAPIGLTASVHRPGDVALSWAAGPSADVAGYLVYRALGAGALALVTPQALANTNYLQPAVADGSYRYVVRAVDAAGNESAPSNEVAVRVDGTPPQALLAAPAVGAVLGGVVSVRGTAWSLDDFREYRLLIGSGQAPTSLTLLSRGTVPTRNAVLGEVDTSTLPAGSVQTVVLEAEDLSGNVSSASVSFETDNAAPPAPILISATASQNNVSVVWQEVTAPDLRGYLVYRDGAIANAPAGQSFADFSPYILPPGTPSFSDPNLPDGVHSWQVQAVDGALNLSALSNSLSVEIDLRSPIATIVTPVHLSRIAGLTTIVASTIDQDLAQVQFEVRAHPAGGFVPLGPARTAAPYVATFDPANYPGAHIFELRAIARDVAGNVDLEPFSTFVFLEDPPAAPVVTTSVSGSNATINWASPGTAFEVLRPPNMDPVLPWSGYLTGTASATSEAPSYPATQGLDGNSSSRWRAEPSFPQEWTAEFVSPRFVTYFDVRLPAGTTVQLSARVSGLWIPLAPARLEPSSQKSWSTSAPILFEGLRIRFLSGPVAEVTELWVQALSVVSAPPVVDGNRLPATHAYVVRSRSPFGSTSDGAGSAVVFEPVLADIPSRVGDPMLVVSGSGATAGGVVDLAVNGVNVAQTTAGPTGTFSAAVRLTEGLNSIVAIATDTLGNRSRPSTTISTTYVLPPIALISLALDGVSGSAVSLSFAVAGPLTNIVGFEVRRTRGGSSIAVGSLPANATTFVDSAVPNGPHSYVVAAYNADRFAGAPSNTVQATVQAALLPAPVLTSVVAPASGASLELTWTHPGGATQFLVERSTAAAGPFVSAATITSFSYRDLGRPNLVTVFYRVIALDAARNASAPSNVLSGTPVDAVGPPPPRLSRPTVPAAPVTVTNTFSAVGGSSELNATVELFRNGQSQGRVVASTRELALERLTTATPPVSPSLSPTGDRLAYFRGASNAYQLVVENTSTHQLTVFTPPTGTRFSFADLTVWSPDGTRFALVASQDVDSSIRVLVGDLASGTLTRTPALTGRRFEGEVKFSPDSRKIAFESSFSDSRIVVQDLATGTISESPPLLRKPTWLPGTPSLLALSDRSGGATDVIRFDTTSWARTVVWSAPTNISSISISPSGETLAAEVSVVPNYTAVGIDFLDLASSTTARLFQLPSNTTVLRNLSWGFDGSIFSYVLNGTLFHVSPGSAPVSMGPVAFTRLEHRGANDYFIVDASGPAVATLAGRFDFARVQLAQGLNGFYAVATDQSGNTGAPSELIRVTSAPTSPVDLSVALALQPAVVQPGGAVTALLTVTNAGPTTVISPTVSVTLSGGNGSVSQLPLVTVPATLSSGASAAVTVQLVTTGLTGAGHTVTAVVDPARTTSDTNLANNTATATFAVLTSGAPVVSVALGNGVLSSADDTLATVTITNPGADAVLSVQARLLDAAGALVTVLGPAVAYNPLAAGSSNSFSRTVSAVGLQPGDYVVAVEASNGSAIVSHAEAPVRVLVDRATRLVLSSVRSTWQPGELVRVDARVFNDSSNASLTGATLSLQVSSSAGALVHSDNVALPVMAPGTSSLMTFTVAARALGAGTFAATGTLILPGTGTLATSTAALHVAGSALLVASLTPQGTGSPVSVRQGLPAVVNFEIQNLGTSPSAALTANLRFTRLESGLVVATIAVPLGTLGSGSAFPSSVTLPTSTWPLGTYAVSLSIDDGVQSTSAASARLRLVDGAGPRLTVLSPFDGAIVAGRPVLQARVQDNSAGVASVGAVLDGASSLGLTLVTGTALDGLWAASLPALSEGTHSIEFSADDLEGNQSAWVPLSITVDTTAPSITLSGVQNGAFYAVPVAPSWAVSDLHGVRSEALLDGVPFFPGASIAGEGAHDLEIVAVDVAGNESYAFASFELDTVAPTLTLTGIRDGLVSAQTVVPVVSAADRNLLSLVVTLNGMPFSPGTPVANEGDYLFTAVATDSSGHTQRLTIHFSIDRTLPVVTLGGFTEGQLTQGPVLPTINVIDAHPAGVLLTLNGQPYVEGTPVSSNGPWTLLAIAEDGAGQRVQATGHFTIDRTPLTVLILGVTPGQISRLPLAPTIQAASGARVVALLDGVPFVSGTPVSVEGAHTLTATASDAMGNVATVSVTFAIDTIPPAVTLAGFVEGSVTAGPVAPVITVTDANPGSTTGTINGIAFSSGTAISVEGDFTISAVATDAAGNVGTATGSFTIDTTAPAIAVTGVTNGLVSALPVTPTISVTELHLVSSTASLNGVPFVSGTTVTADGQYTLQVVATDAAGSSTARAVNFTVDTTPPVITLTGVAEGDVGAVFTPVFTVADATVVTVVARLDGQPFASGAVVGAAGSHTLEVTAVDGAGNTSTLTVHFTITASTLRPVFNYAACGLVSVRIDNGCEVKGTGGALASVASNGDLTLQKHAQVLGDLVSGGSTLLSNNSYASGRSYHGGTLTLRANASLAQGSTQLAVPPRPCDCGFDVGAALAEVALRNDNQLLAGTPGFSGGSLVVSSGTVTLRAGRYSLSSLEVRSGGRLTVAAGAVVELYVSGAVQVRNNAFLGAAPGAPGLLVVSGASGLTPVEIRNNATAKLLLYAPRAAVEIQNNAVFYGAVVGREVHLANNQTLILDGLTQVTPPPLVCQ